MNFSNSTIPYMKKNIFIALAFLFLIACGSKKKLTGNAAIGDSRTKPVVYLDDNTYLLMDKSTDPTYGYSPQNAIKVGERSPANERRFLNALLGPNGEPVYYFRAGSCCSFKTPNGLFNNSGMMDNYSVYYEGSKDTVSIFINMYDEGNLMIPVGFTAKSE